MGKKKEKELLEDVKSLFSSDSIHSTISSIDDINWGWLVRNVKMSEEFILKWGKDYLNCFDITLFQVMTPKLIEKFEDDISKEGYWALLLSSNLLDEETIIKYIDKLSEYHETLINTQKLSSQAIYKLLDTDYGRNNRFEIFKELACSQSLEEDFIIDNYYNLGLSNILSSQRITPSLISKIEDSISPGFSIAFKNSLFNASGVHSKLDIGKDWFVCLVCPHLSDKYNNIWEGVSMSIIENSKEFDITGTKFYKARIWYKNIITNRIYKDVEVIRDNNQNIYKRGNFY